MTPQLDYGKVTVVYLLIIISSYMRENLDRSMKNGMTKQRMCCSAHGFKLSAVVGRILGDLATSGRSDYDLSHFAMSRFSAGTSASKL